MWLLIQPNDTLFMRDGRPFDAGADVWAGYIFPPHPPTVYGMLRTLLVQQVSLTVDFRDFFKHVPPEHQTLLGDSTKPGTLSSRGPFLARRDGDIIDVYVPRPADLYFHAEDEQSRERRFYLLQPNPNGPRLNEFSDARHPFLKLSFSSDPDDPEPEPESWSIGGDALNAYLMGHAPNGHLLDDELDVLWREEPTTIIERETNLTAKDHQLAHPEFIRMNPDAGLLIQIDDAHASRFEKRHTVRLGGECRVCCLETREVETIVDPEAMTKRIMDAGGRFKALLTSPGYFPRKGYYPDFLTEIDGETGFPEGEWEIGCGKRTVQLKTLACGRAVRIGGWDLARGKPKTMIKAVPAGGVFYFEMEAFDEKRDKEWVSELVAAGYPGILPGGSAQYVKEGFNTILIGGWDYVS